MRMSGGGSMGMSGESPWLLWTLFSNPGCACVSPVLQTNVTSVIRLILIFRHAFWVADPEVSHGRYGLRGTPGHGSPCGWRHGRWHDAQRNGNVCLRWTGEAFIFFVVLSSIFRVCHPGSFWFPELMSGSGSLVWHFDVPSKDSAACHTCPWFPPLWSTCTKPESPTVLLSSLWWGFCKSCQVLASQRQAPYTSEST